MPTKRKGIKGIKISQEPVWKGPEEDGITQSLLGLFLVCRERFRLRTIEGLSAPPEFNHSIEYGNMWHECEEAHAEGKDWKKPLKDYCAQLCMKYKTQQQQIQKWFEVCKIQFPVYVEYWKHHKDMKKRTPLLQEEVFKVPHLLPSGRTVNLKGKWDSVDIVGTGKSRRVWLQENKTKGDIKDHLIERQLSFDIQTGIYLTSLAEGKTLPAKLEGVRYNVVRRPLSGGKGSIRQHKPTKKNPEGESAEHYYGRLKDIIDEDPGHFFMRWNVEVSAQDLDKFKTHFLDPVLEQLCDWWEWIMIDPFDPWRVDFEGRYYGIHWRHPYGVYNPLNEGRSTNLDEYLKTGNELGLVRTTNLFPEL
jgi:hypothetical protein